MHVNRHSTPGYMPLEKDKSADQTDENKGNSRQSHQSTETCRKDGREMKLTGTLHDGKFFVAAPAQGEKPVVWKAIEQDGKLIFVEDGTTANCWVPDNSRKNNRGVWKDLDGQYRSGGRQFKTPNGHVYNKTEAGFVRSGVGGTGEMEIDESPVQARVRMATEAVNAWVNEYPPGTLERADREDAASMRLKCLGGEKAFVLNHLSTIDELPPNYFVGMPDVHTLDLQFNPCLESLEGTGYEELVNLQKLLLNYCPLKGSKGDVNVGQFSRLRILETRQTTDPSSADSYLSAIKGLDKLNSLARLIGGGQISLEEIHNLSSSLTCLKIEEYGFELDDDHGNFKELKHLTHLEELEIAADTLAGLECLPNLRILKTFCLEGDTFAAFAELKKLEALDVSLNPSQALDGLEKAPSLKRLHLRFALMTAFDADEKEESEIFRAINKEVLQQLDANGVEVTWDRQEKYIAPLSLEAQLKKSTAQFESKLEEMEHRQRLLYQVATTSIAGLVGQERQKHQIQLEQLKEDFTQVGAHLVNRVSAIEGTIASPVQRHKQISIPQKDIWKQMNAIGMDPGKKAYMETVNVVLYSMLQRAFGNLPLVENMGGSSIQSAGVLPLSIVSSSSTIAGTVVGEISTAAGAFLGIDPLTKILQAVVDAYGVHDFNKKALGLAGMLGTELDRIFELCHTLARAMTQMKAPDLPPGSVPEPARKTSIWKKLKAEFTHQSRRLDGTAGLNAKATEKQIETCVHAAQILLGIVSGKAFGLESHEVRQHFTLEQMVEEGLKWFCKEQDRGEFQFDAKHIVWGVANKNFKPEKNASASASTSTSTSTSAPQPAAAPSSRPSTPGSESGMSGLMHQVVGKLEEQVAFINKLNQKMTQLHTEHAQEIATLRTEYAQKITQLHVEQQQLTSKVIELEKTLDQKSRMQNDNIKMQMEMMQNLIGTNDKLQAENQELRRALSTLLPDVEELKRQLPYYPDQGDAKKRRV